MGVVNKVMNDMLNGQTKAEIAKGKIVYIDAEKLIENKLNKYPLSEINELVENIAEGGLYQPLIITKENNQNIVNAGHRRLAALRLCFEKGQTISFMGRELDGDVPCIIQETPDDKLSERISLMRSNSHRNYTKDERRTILDEAQECYRELVKKGNKPKGREREWITAVTGFSDGLVKEYLALLNKSKEKESNSDTKDDKKPRSLKSITTKMNKLAELLEEIDSQFISNSSKDDQEELNSASKVLAAALDWVKSI